MTGRRKHPIWQHFKQVSAKPGSKMSTRARCKKCQTEIVPLVARMKKHTILCAKNFRSCSSEHRQQKNQEMIATSDMSASESESESTITFSKKGEFLSKNSRYSLFVF